MNLAQTKLTLDEWNSIEIPVSEKERQILKLIQNSYIDLDYSQNNTQSMLLFLKASYSDTIDNYIYITYFEKLIIKNLSYSYTDKLQYDKVKSLKTKLKQRDILRFKNADNLLERSKQNIFEYIILDIFKRVIKKREANNNAWVIGYYTIIYLLKNGNATCNTTFKIQLNKLLIKLKDEITIKDLIYRGKELIEQNTYLLKYSDDKLYKHQKILFREFKNNSNPKLILYIAPTGTGKTISPIGLTDQYKIIFVCAARHVGLALAKSAISANKCLAFAFGCEEDTDIRLHYNSAKRFERDRRTGGIRKVDNLVGDDVEIMITDLQSYILAMNYMCKFNNTKDIITYWDEPTITLDYETHECHDLIKTIWRENIIPNVVLSSATLPRLQEIESTITSFKTKFKGAEVIEINSFDCKKTIPLINREGYIEAPHYLYQQYGDLVECCKYCLINKTLLRYIDLDTIIECIKAINDRFQDSILDNEYLLENYFKEISKITLYNIKIYYLVLLTKLKPDRWLDIISYLNATREHHHKSNIYISTQDAYTLTDGPTIFLAENIDKIGLFALKQANIPKDILTNILHTLDKNNKINEQLTKLSKRLEDLTSKDSNNNNTKKLGDVNRGSPEEKQLHNTIKSLQESIDVISLPKKYIPNTNEHLSVYGKLSLHKSKAFTSDIDMSDIEKILMIDDIDDYWKILLMMGIGVFISHKSIKYMEIMKRLASSQSLYLIIASSDFIYGTNYQFCHGYISTDLKNISQEKIIQAMGRVGRGKIQQDYSFRFRNNQNIYNLFKYAKDKPEVLNMNRLFC